MTCVLPAVGGAEKIEYKVCYAENGKEKKFICYASPSSTWICFLGGRIEKFMCKVRSVLATDDR